MEKVLSLRTLDLEINIVSFSCKAICKTTANIEQFILHYIADCLICGFFALITLFSCVKTVVLFMQIVTSKA